MTPQSSSRAGFTLLEVLVASILLGMLVTVLTMIFNSSSIAWRTGKASVVEMDEVRGNMAGASIAADNAVPRVDTQDPSTWGCLVSPWTPDGEMRKRGVEKMSSSKIANKYWSSMNMSSTLKNPGKESGPGTWTRTTGGRLWATIQPGHIGMGRNVASYAVGVMSLGPEEYNDKDDISTWPDTK